MSLLWGAMHKLVNSIFDQRKSRQLCVSVQSDQSIPLFRRYIVQYSEIQYTGNKSTDQTARICTLFYILRPFKAVPLLQFFHYENMPIHFTTIKKEKKKKKNFR